MKNGTESDFSEINKNSVKHEDFRILLLIGFKELKISQEVARDSKNPFKPRETDAGYYRFL